MRASLASYARYWREAFRLPSMDLESAAAGASTRRTGPRISQEALDAGRGAVLALPHSGNWDMAGVWLVHQHGTFTTVAERLKPESLYRRFIAYRESLGFEMVPLTGGDRPPYELLVERLRDNRVVCLMADRDLTRAGVQVDFFGEPTRMPAGPAKLAMRDRGGAAAGALLVRARTAGASSIRPELDTSAGDVGAITQALADRFADDIAAHPGRLAHAAAAMAGRPAPRSGGPGWPSSPGSA